MNLNTKTIILICLLFTQTTHPTLLHAQTTDKPVHSAHSILIEAAATSVIVSGLIVICCLTAPEDVQQSLKHQMQPSALTLNFLQEYSTSAVSTITHEVGHCLAQYVITGQIGRIHLGSTQHGDKPLIDLGHVHIDGFIPNQGHTEQMFIKTQQAHAAVAQFIAQYCVDHNLDPANLSNAQLHTMVQSPAFTEFKKELLPDRRTYAAFLLAGAASGLIAHHLIKRSLKPDHITFLELFNAFVPFQQQSDGAALWRDCIGVSDDTIAQIIKVAHLIDMSLELYCSVHNMHNLSSAPLHSKLLIGLANYFSRGFLRFHA
jgi:hypothetical protein